jgi:ankyrin repeat protein
MIGNPNGVPWGRTVRPDTVSDVLGDQVNFQSPMIVPGYSGGALLAGNGLLIGMIQADGPLYGRALEIHRLLSILRSWNYPVDLYVRGDDSPLVAAVDRGDLAAVKASLGRSCTDVNARSYADADTALERAVLKARNDVAALLFDAGAKLETVNRRRRTPLLEAVNTGNVEMIRLLIARGAEVNNKAMSPLVEAAALGNPQIIRALLAGGADPNLSENPSFASDHWLYGPPLVVAAEAGRFDAVQALLAGGADPNGRGQYGLGVIHGGETAIYHALVGHGSRKTGYGSRIDKHERLKILRALIQFGADVNWETAAGNTPLIAAIESRPNYIGEEAIGLAGVEMLLAAGADPNIPTDHNPNLPGGVWGKGDTAIHRAVRMFAQANRSEYLKILRALIQAGADVNRSNEKGETPLMIALDCPDAMAALLDAGADPSAKGPRGSTVNILFDPTGYGEEEQRLRAVTLLRHARKIAAPDREHLLERAAWHGWDEVAGLVLGPGGELKKQTVQQALYTAVIFLKTGLVRALLEHGANPDDDGRPGSRYTVLYALLSYGLGSSFTDDGPSAGKEAWRILDLLVSKGASVNKGHPLEAVILGRGPRLKLAQYLISHGAEVLREDIDQFRDTVMVRRPDSSELLELLLKAQSQQQHR